MQLPPTVRQKVQVLIKARDDLETALLAAMANEAERLELDSYVVTHLGNSAMKDGKEIIANMLDALDDCYCEHVHYGGFEGVWRAEDGWS